MSEEGGSSSSLFGWLKEAVISNGLALGVGFLALAIYRNVRLEQRKQVTSVKHGQYMAPQAESKLMKSYHDLCCTEQRRAVTEWMHDTEGRMMVVIGARGSGRSSLVKQVVADHWRGTSFSIDLLAMPSETVSAWTPRLSEANNGGILGRWQLFRSAFQQLYEILRGAGLDSNALDAAHMDEDASGPPLIAAFREGLRLVEGDLLEERAKSGRLVLILDGLDSLSHLAATDVGRRAVAVFLEWLRRLANADVASVLATSDGAFFLDFFVLSARLRDARAVCLENVSPELLPKFVSDPKPFEGHAAHPCELVALMRGDWAQSMHASQVRYRTALTTPAACLRFAPLEIASRATWDCHHLGDVLKTLLEHSTGVPIAQVQSLCSVEELLLWNRLELVEFDAARFLVRLPRAADYVAIHNLLQDKCFTFSSSSTQLNDT